MSRSTALFIQHDLSMNYSRETFDITIRLLNREKLTASHFLFLLKTGC